MKILILFLFPLSCFSQSIKQNKAQIKPVVISTIITFSNGSSKILKEDTCTIMFISPNIQYNNDSSVNVNYSIMNSSGVYIWSKDWHLGFDEVSQWDYLSSLFKGCNNEFFDNNLIFIK